MSTSEKIRTLAAEGVPIAEIARSLDIRYQHAYGVLHNRETRPSQAPRVVRKSACAPHTRASVAKPELSTRVLLDGRFVLAGRWTLTETGEIKADAEMLKEAGVYAFARNGVVQYVGVATSQLHLRFRSYCRPGSTQMTSIRLNATIKEELRAGDVIEIYTASPDDLEWNGLPVHASAGLELGLIKKYSLPWNKRSAG